jgi:hypothetical protein
MSVKDRLLLFSTVPQPDESFLGYLLRLTQLNCYESPSWIMQMAGLATTVGSTSFVFNNSQGLEPLARLTGVNKDKLTELIYQTADPIRRKMGNYLLFGSAITQYLIRPDRPKICPSCIRESGYTRRMWEIIPVTTCLIHKCLLLDECPNCQARISWNRENLSQCRCKFDWSEYQPLTVEEDELLVTKQIYWLCNFIPAENRIIDRLSSPNPLYNLDLKHFLSALIFVASQYGGFIDTKGKFLVSVKSNAEIHMLLCKAFSAFENWPKNFFSFLDWRRAQRPKKKFAHGLRREFSEYKSVLYRQLSSTNLDFMRKAFEDYLAVQWKGGYLNQMRRLAASARRKAKYCSMTEAKKMLQTSYIYELIEAGKLNAIVEQQRKRKLVLIERASLNDLKLALERALGLMQLCKLLALSSPRVRELVKAGLITPLRGPTIDGLTTWKFHNNEARKWLDVFKDKTIVCTKTQAHKKLTFKEVLVKLDSYGVALSKLMQAVLSGEISPSGMNRQRGLMKFLFSDEQITDFLRGASQLQGEEAYSVAAVAKLLKTSKRIVFLLIRSNFIHAKKISHLSSAGLTITKTQMERFYSEFLLAKDIASQLNTNPRYICELLIAHGIYPVLTRKSNKYAVTIFKRSELDDINLDSLVALAKSEARIILPSPLKTRGPDVLNEIQAADTLGITVDMVEKLVERGVLKQHRYQCPNKGSGEKYLFSANTIEKCKRRATSCKSVVSFLAAAKMLGSGPDTFYRRYVRTGRLQAVMTGNQRSEYYFSLGDVETVVRLKEQTITASEAAAICKVNISCINKLTVDGELNPISGPNVDGFGHNLYLQPDVERLHAYREAFKEKRNSQGRTSRFGRLTGQQRSPVLERIRPRVSRLCRQWNAKSRERRISGQRIHRQLIKEGYQVGINTVYVCLRELRQQASSH